MGKKSWPVLAIVGALLLFLGLATAAFAAEAGKGTIKGSLVNLTAGGGSVAGLDVNLLVYQGQNQSGKQTTKAGQDGKFSFEGLETNEDFTYLIHVQYQGVDYAGEPMTFPADTTELTAEVEVFDATSAENTVKSAAKHYLLEPDPTGVTVSEIVIISNPTDKTYVGSKEIHPGIKETLRFTLPEGAEDVEYGGGMMGSRVFPVDGGLVDSWPVYPGDSQHIFRYRIPAKGDAVSFATKITLPTEKVNALLPDIGVGISVSNLPNKSNPTIQGEKFVLFSGDQLAADTELQFRLDRLPKAQGAASDGVLPLITGIGILLIVVLGFVAFVLIRRRRGRPARAMAPAPEDEESETVEMEAAEPEIDTTEEEENLEAEKKELVAAIARLDDEFEAGKVGSEEYGRLRAEKKRRLVEVVDRQKSLVAARGDQ